MRIDDDQLKSIRELLSSDEGSCLMDLGDIIRGIDKSAARINVNLNRIANALEQLVMVLNTRED